MAIDPGSQRLRAHVRWPSPVSVLLGGMRPHPFDWYEVTTPSRVLGDGWALTLELAAGPDCCRLRIARAVRRAAGGRSCFQRVGQVWGGGCDLDLRLQGTWPRRFWRAPTLTASVDGVVVWEGRLARPFDERMRLSSRTGLQPLRIDFIVSHAFMGGDGSGSADARRLSLEVHTVSVSPTDGRRACRPDDRATSPASDSDDRR